MPQSQSELHQLALRELASDGTVTPRAGLENQIQRSIAAALARESQRELDCVHVGVKHGCASLSGRVPSWHAWKCVHDAVERTPGVQSVDDLLQIDPHPSWAFTRAKAVHKDNHPQATQPAVNETQPCMKLNPTSS